MNIESDAGRRALWGWSLYDFANSAFTTLVVTFIYSAYFTRGIATDVVSGTTYWSRAMAISSITVALLSPALGAIADGCGCRRRFLAGTTALCVIATVGLYFPGPGQVVLALTWFVIANVCFELGGVFYNAFLPHLVSIDRVGRLSGIGWAVGYVGGLLCMGLAMVGFVNTETPWLGFVTDGEHIRAVNLLVAAWFAIFSLPFFLWVREPKSNSSTRSPGAAARAAFGELADTITHIRRYRQIARLLLARLLYNDGMVTVFAFGGIYATGTLGFTLKDLMVFGLVLNVAAGIGAFAFGFLDDRLGGKRTIQISVAGLVLASLAAVTTVDIQIFWAAAIGIGLLSGPAQAASRSLMARFIPHGKESEFFGLYAFSGKATAFIGPLLLGILTDVFDSQRVGMSVVVALLIAGGLVLIGVDEDEGRRTGRD
ncbi:MAG: MFS transporter [Gemmatimonadetes bacterium]|jgi:MFS transporter, UMF1 family|nr:MFS transporter [Gemmatimonadota bacterium]MBT6146128.1 MFS transporter [Gemmatimonadota bacterium]MBT7859814.1 MFS transporter [Gemmatimonadota bacterium]